MNKTISRPIFVIDHRRSRVGLRSDRRCEVHLQTRDNLEERRLIEPRGLNACSSEL